MRVLHLGKFFPPHYGGIETVTRDLADGLHEVGVQSDVLAFSRNPAIEESRDAPRPYRVFRAHTPWVVASMPISLAYLGEMRRRCHDYDVLHVHVPNPLASIGLWLLRPRAKIVVHWHSDIVRQKILRLAFRPVERWMLKRADAVIAATPPYAESSPSLRDFRDKVTVIPYGVRPLPERGDPADLPVEARIDRQVVLGIGRLVYYKGFAHLIDAAALLPEGYKILIVGDGPLRSELQARIDDRGLRQRVVLLGRVSDAQVAALLRHAAVFCLPSVERSEAFGVVQVEAMSAGVPVIATNIPGSGTAWVNAHGDSGLNVAVGDPVGLARAIVDITADSTARLRFSERASKRYHDVFTITGMISRVVTLYRNLLVDADREAAPRPVPNQSNIHPPGSTSPLC